MARGHARPGEIRRLLVDGRNLQGAMSRQMPAGSLPDRAFVASVVAAVPPEALTELLLDGYPTGGILARVGPRFRLEFTKGRTADQRIAELIETAAADLGPIGMDGVMVVSDDREVRDQARRHGARVEGTAWLLGRRASGPPGLSRAARAGTSLGQGRPPRTPRQDRDSR
jgi:hypothetical protein